MADNISNLHPNTIVFHCLEDSVAILIADIVHAIYSILNWRQSSKSFLIEILARLGEESKCECSHLNFAEILFPSLEEVARKVKVGRWAQKLNEDVRDSLFAAVIIVPRRVGQSENGKFYGLPTLYKRGQFWKLFRAVQDAALKCNLMSLPLRNRRQKIRAIVETYLMQTGARRIVREKKDRVERETSECEKKLKPCKCDCATCAFCVVKNPETSAASLAKGVTGGRVTKELVEMRLHSYADALLECGQDWMSLGLDFQTFNRKLQTDFDDILRRLQSAVARSNRSGLKLVGGQPK